MERVGDFVEQLERVTFINLFLTELRLATSKSFVLRMYMYLVFYFVCLQPYLYPYCTCTGLFLSAI